MKKSQCLSDEKIKNLRQKRSRMTEVKKFTDIIITLIQFHLAPFEYNNFKYLKATNRNHEILINCHENSSKKNLEENKLNNNLKNKFSKVKE